MDAVVWIVEGSWEACVDRAREVLPADASVTLLHVAASDVEELATAPGLGRLGRRRVPPGPAIREISDTEAQSLLQAARERLGRPAALAARRGRVEHEVVDACSGADLLVLTRDGELRAGPPSLGRRARFVVDHATCTVLLVWAGVPAPARRPPPGHRPPPPPPPPRDR